MKRTLRQLLAEISVKVPDIPFSVRFWDGDTTNFGRASPLFTIDVKTERALKSIFSRGSTGFREEYVAGDIDVIGDIQALMRIGTDRAVEGIRLSPGTKASIIFQGVRARNSLRNSPAHIAHHYDLGNDFYKLFLDESMTYSCAYFKSRTDSLERAQQQKYEYLCRKLMLSEGERVIDIGCGWGGFLIYAVQKFGITATGCTLSKQQADYAKNLVSRAGMEKSIDILLEDYRNVTGEFDKFVSVGMFEHVGKVYIPTFLDKAEKLLKPGGIGVLHTIGKEKDSPGDPWTLKYIFPGGYIPVLDHILHCMGVKGLVPVDMENLRLHYAATLEEWISRFESNAGRIEEMLGGPFVRMWRMYLNGCAATFRWGDLRLYQITFTKGTNNSLPLTREHLYEGGDGAE